MDKDWLDYAVAIGAISTPLLVLLLTGVGWKLRQSFERKAKLEENLRDDRIEIYNKILEPFIIALTSDAVWKKDPKYKNKNKEEIVESKMLSLDYRIASFRLSLIGADPVVISFNNLMQSFFSAKDGSIAPDKIISLVGDFLLEIRKNMGNEFTKIDNFGMLEWFITDIETLRK